MRHFYQYRLRPRFGFPFVSLVTTLSAAEILLATMNHHAANPLIKRVVVLTKDATL